MATPTSRRIKKYGWRPDLPDQRDFLYAAPPATLTALPAKVDLRSDAPALPEVYDQGELGSCTANATAAAVQYARRKQTQQGDFTPSRLFIYYNTRAIEGTVSTDSGAQLRDTMRAVSKLGVCTSETHWPYQIVKFTDKPTQEAFDFALDYQVVSYKRIAQNPSQMKGCLASGFPFVFGFTVYDSFESDAVAQNGIVPLPGGNEGVLGGHAVLAVGYDDAKSTFIVRNSWGPKWGDGGYCYMPYAYLGNSTLATDFWTVRMVEA